MTFFKILPGGYQWARGTNIEWLTDSVRGDVTPRHHHLQAGAEGKLGRSLFLEFRQIISFLLGRKMRKSFENIPQVPDWAETEMYLCLNNCWSVYFVNIASSVRLNIYSWGKNCSDAHYQIPAASTPHTTGINNPSKYLSFYKLSNWNIQNKGTIIWCPLNV